MLTPEQTLAIAVHTVTDMLEKKKEIWTQNIGLYDNFRIHEDIGINDIQSGLHMCKLKMKRAATRYAASQDVANDKEIEDSLIDLASFALLTLGMLYENREKSTSIKHEHVLNNLLASA